MCDWSLERWLSGKQRDTFDVVLLSHVLPIRHHRERGKIHVLVTILPPCANPVPAMHSRMSPISRVASPPLVIRDPGRLREVWLVADRDLRPVSLISSETIPEYCSQEPDLKRIRRERTFFAVTLPSRIKPPTSRLLVPVIR
jgi:hypothetical protein